MNYIEKTVDWAGRKITIEAGKLAQHANGSVVVKCGNTTILVTAVGKKEAKDDVDFFPLTVNYIEKSYAKGKIPGGFMKRETKPSERETLISRMIDRPIRPMFPEGFFNEVQIMCTVLSYDDEIDSDILSFIGASAALYISDIPFSEPLCAAKIGMVDGKFVLNPTVSQLKKSKLDLIISGTKESLLMIEAASSEISEDEMLEALEFGHKNFTPIIELLEELRKETGREKWELPKFDIKSLSTKIESDFGKDIKKCYDITLKTERLEAIDIIKQKAEAKYCDENNIILFKKAFKTVQQDIVRNRTIDGTRIDSRGLDEIREITCETDVLNKVHGSALFTRGGTQALVVTTLGAADDAQITDDLSGEGKENFMLHYNFPPFSVGECGMLRAPGRREIGHGKLASRGISAVLAFKGHDEFLYPTIRVVSEILGSDGSSSMATVCGTSLALMSSGIPMKAPVAGIAMGLIKEEKKFAVLSDITGEEDSLGDMDFKVVGTEAGITALQMDIKIQGINFEVMKTALEQARKGRLHILNIMNETISESRIEVNKTAPVIRKMRIDPSRIREIIGSGGKNIKHICETSGGSIDIDDSGVLLITCASHESYAVALEEINKILNAEKSDSRRGSGGPGGRRDRNDRGGDRRGRSGDYRGDRRDGSNRNDRGGGDRRDRGNRNDRGSDRRDGGRKQYNNGENQDRRNDRGNRGNSNNSDNNGDAPKKRFKFF